MPSEAQLERPPDPDTEPVPGPRSHALRAEHLGETYLTTGQVAELLGYRTRAGVHMAIRRGELAAVGKRGRTLVFRKSDAIAMLRVRPSVGVVTGELHHDEPPRAPGRARHLPTEQEYIPVSGSASQTRRRGSATRSARRSRGACAPLEANERRCVSSSSRRWRRTARRSNA
ncbi:MAG: helix-turn-helix domain-containing protein [Sandaracinaceae bacterium]|nr:helix-turn-helix domain-containing protein [Sandaracinaceae bacterium]